MIKVEGTTIKAYRGASGYIRVSKTDDDGNIEQFAANDVITLTVKNNFGEFAYEIFLLKINNLMHKNPNL